MPRFTVNLTDEDYRDLKEFARMEQRPVADFARSAILYDLNNKRRIRNAVREVYKKERT